MIGTDADIWSLGIVTWELLTGDVLYPNERNSYEGMRDILLPYFLFEEVD